MLDFTSFTYATADHKAWQRWTIKTLERLTGQLRLWRLYSEYQKEFPQTEETFWEAALRRLEIAMEYDTEALQAVPKQGPVVFVANHPYGVIDGLILNKLVSNIRQDYKVLTNSVLCQAPEVKDTLLPIDFSSTRAAVETNLATRKAAKEVLQNGGCIAAFPAGGVSTISGWGEKVALDTEWHTFVARLIQDSKATVVPVFFEGQNSRLFQWVSLVSPTLRLALFFKEVVDKIGSRVGLQIGAPIPYTQLEGFKDRVALCAHLRAKTYALGGILESKPPKPVHRTKAS